MRFTKKKNEFDCQIIDNQIIGDLDTSIRLVSVKEDEKPDLLTLKSGIRAGKNYFYMKNVTILPKKMFEREYKKKDKIDRFIENIRNYFLYRNK